ncbi:MAG: sulfatase-like hydrolase/transferase [Planctomycetota bacterium]|nr:sulfatase-like hydrolase/transferase [Planctomycetota bacterium]
MWCLILLCTVLSGYFERAFPNGIADRQPNLILVFADDQGYNDIGCFGAPKLRTPHLDRLAAEGIRMTSFYSAAPVCTPSRAALLTGCYPGRVGKLPVLFPRSDIGLHPDETTLAELLKAAGYETACFGKWHLGHHPAFLPTANGFDQYFGIPYSNDMGVDPDMKISPNVVWREGADAVRFRQGAVKLPPLFEGDEVIEWPVDQTTLTARYTEKSIQWIQSVAKREKPFFLFLPHTMPHIPLYASEKFRGQSESGLYGDAIEEIDFCMGRLVETLRRLDLADNTIVVYTSDNGPWKLKGNRTDKVKGNRNRRIGGSAHPLRGHKFSTWEGGMRVPTIIWGPGHLAKGKVCDEVAGTIDILPTFARLAGSDLPARKIDGKDISGLLLDSEAMSPHVAYFYRTDAVRQGFWKLRGNELFHLSRDIGESRDLSGEHPDVVARLKKLLDDHRRELREQGRPPGRVKRPPRPVSGLPQWKRCSGQWEFSSEGVLRQNQLRGESLVFGPRLTAGQFTLTLKARLKKGSEGFRVVVGASDPENYLRWSCGAFRNTGHCLVSIRDGKVVERTDLFRGHLEKERWYSLKISAQPDHISCWIDGELVHREKIHVSPGLQIGLGSHLSSVEFKQVRLQTESGEIPFF